MGHMSIGVDLDTDRFLLLAELLNDHQGALGVKISGIGRKVVGVDFYRGADRELEEYLIDADGLLVDCGDGSEWVRGCRECLGRGTVQEAKVLFGEAARRPSAKLRRLSCPACGGTGRGPATPVDPVN